MVRSREKKGEAAEAKHAFDVLVKYALSSFSPSAISLSFEGAGIGTVDLSVFFLLPGCPCSSYSDITAVRSIARRDVA